jgi:hypothetical protein
MSRIVIGISNKIIYPIFRDMFHVMLNGIFLYECKRIHGFPFFVFMEAKLILEKKFRSNDTCIRFIFHSTNYISLCRTLQDYSLFQYTALEWYSSGGKISRFVPLTGNCSL